MSTPGWYPDTTAPGNERYWDGARWTEQSRPIAPQPPPPPAWGAGPQGATPATFMPSTPEAKKNWFMRHKILTGVGAFFVIGGIASAAGSGGTTSGNLASTDTTVTESPKVVQPETTQAPASKPAATQAPVATKAPAPEKPAAPAETSGQRNARRAAANYLDFAPFSRAGLIQQLSSDAGDGYSVADATYAVDSLKTDYNEQAYRAAKNYLSFTAFSRQGLIEQLSSSAGDKYTKAQATFGADKALAE